MAIAALLADDGQCRLQRAEVLDLALGVRSRLGKACDMLPRSRPCLPRSSLRCCSRVAGFEPFTLSAETALEVLLGGVVELGERRIDGGLIVGLFALDHRFQRSAPSRLRSCHCPSIRSDPAASAYPVAPHGPTPSNSVPHHCDSSHHHSGSPVFWRGCCKRVRDSRLQHRQSRFIPSAGHYRLCRRWCSRIAIQTRSAVAGMSI